MPSQSRPQSRARTAKPPEGEAPFFPKPYPGETLYSVVARYQRGRQLDNVALQIDMFGKECRVFSPTLPSSVGRIAARAAGLGLSVDDLILDHTAHRYYTAYVPNEEAQKLATEMMEEEGKPVMTAGQRGAPVGLLPFMRFCPECLAAMATENDGETYWRLAHQIPIVAVCVDHGGLLLESTIPGTGVIPGFQVPNAKNCPDGASPVVSTSTDVAMLQRLATAAVGLLTAPRRHPDDWRNDLRSELRRRDLLFPTGRYRQGAIQRLINETLSPMMPAFPDLALKVDDRQTWFGFQTMPVRRSSTDRVLMIELALDMLP